MDNDKRKELEERIRSDFENRVKIYNQKKYVNRLKKELSLPSTFSQASLSRHISKLGFTTKGNYLVAKDPIAGSNFKKELDLFLREASSGFRRISETFIFLSIGNDYSFRAKKNIQGLFSEVILSILRDDDGNLIIITKDNENADKISIFLSETMRLTSI